MQKKMLKIVLGSFFIVPDEIQKTQLKPTLLMINFPTHDD